MIFEGMDCPNNNLKSITKMIDNETQFFLISSVL